MHLSVRVRFRVRVRIRFRVRVTVRGTVQPVLVARDTLAPCDKRSQTTL